ncbi:hypothetical protein COY27_06425 [Candidatus Woesearchaeota archaeon CG_4_10_14_0_2_um_filter_33_13]|nr:MAG: hypothetical protein COY27_06425 [Candidatus Woesearchaeota archaeon CG_4_10_14_0_2_um_filter_33_13]
MKKNKLNELHEALTNKEGIATDYILYQAIKNLFNVPRLSFYDFGIVKQTIQRALKQRGY